MNMLTRKNEKWQWEEAQQKAFDKLKQVFTMKPVLAALELCYWRNTLDKVLR